MISYAKTALALLSAALAGYVFGVYMVANSVPVISIGRETMPTWFVAAEAQYTVAAGGAVVAALGWVYLDYRYVVKNERGE